MMGRLKSDQGQLFYEFHRDDAVPKIIWKIDVALDRSGFAASLRLIICPWVVHRSTRN
jgi:hypothetical protein